MSDAVPVDFMPIAVSVVSLLIGGIVTLTVTNSNNWISRCIKRQQMKRQLKGEARNARRHYQHSLRLQIINATSRWKIIARLKMCKIYSNSLSRIETSDLSLLAPHIGDAAIEFFYVIRNNDIWIDEAIASLSSDIEIDPKGKEKIENKIKERMAAGLEISGKLFSRISGV